jgi:hypothetical protein
MRYCWTDRGEVDEQWYRDVYLAVEEVGGQTCMLEDGHDGPHRWTPDSRIGVTFAEPGNGEQPTKENDR